MKSSPGFFLHILFLVMVLAFGLAGSCGGGDDDVGRLADDDDIDDDDDDDDFVPPVDDDDSGDDDTTDDDTTDDDTVDDDTTDDDTTDDDTTDDDTTDDDTTDDDTTDDDTTDDDTTDDDTTDDDTTDDDTTDDDTTDDDTTDDDTTDDDTTDDDTTDDDTTDDDTTDDDTTDDDTTDDDTTDDDTIDDDTTDDDTTDDDTGDDDTTDDDTGDDDTGDDDTSVTWVQCYRDADWDGHGDPNVTDDFPVECPLGWIDDNFDDCDDTNTTIFPSAPEFPDDNVDQNCDGEEMNHSFIIGVYVSPDGDDANPGNAEFPFKTMAYAAGGAAATDRVVFAAAGVYNEQVQTKASIFGGYNKDTWERDIDANETKIAFTGGVYTLRVFASAEQEEVVRIQGLTIEHDGDGGDSVALVGQTTAWIGENMIISFSAGNNSTAANLAGGQYVLFGNTMFGGPAADSSTGVILQADTVALVYDNQIYGAGAPSGAISIGLNGAGYAFIIENFLSGGTVSGMFAIAANLTATAAADEPILLINNDIDGGTLSGSAFSATGVMVAEDCATLLYGNTIDGGDGRLATGSSKTIGIYSQAETLLINNEIDGGLSSDETYGVWLYGDSRLINNVILGGFADEDSIAVLAQEGSLRLTHNVVKGTSAQAGTCAFSQGVVIKPAAQGLLINNILDSGLGDEAYCFAPDGLTPNASLINNDLLYSLGGCAVYDAECITDLTVVNACTWDNCVEAQGNISEDPQFAGADDYHLTAGSLCIDAGVDSRTWDNTRLALYDIDGDLRPIGGWDLGLDEYVAP